MPTETRIWATFFEEEEVEIHAFLTSGLDGGDNQLHALALVKGLHYPLIKLLERSPGYSGEFRRVDVLWPQGSNHDPRNMVVITQCTNHKMCAVSERRSAKPNRTETYVL